MSLFRSGVIPFGKGMAGICAERREPVSMCNLQTDDSGVARPTAKETKVAGALEVVHDQGRSQARALRGVAAVGNATMSGQVFDTANSTLALQIRR